MGDFPGQVEKDWQSPQSGAEHCGSEEGGPLGTKHQRDRRAGTALGPEAGRGAHLTCVHATALALGLDSPRGYFVISSRVSRNGGLWLKRKGVLLSLSKNPPHTWENTPVGNSCPHVGARGFVETPDAPPGFLCTNISPESG